MSFGDDGQPANVIEVAFEAITSMVMGGIYISRPITGFPDFLQRMLLGRGLGRVVAHELRHWLFGRGHLRDSLMKPSFDHRDLVQSIGPGLPSVRSANEGGVAMTRFWRCDPEVHPQ